jgi:Smg protein
LNFKVLLLLSPAATLERGEMNMFDILMYLFENYIHSEAEVFVDHDELTDELLKAGFELDEIYKALGWLEKLADLQNADTIPYLTKPVSQSVRVYTEQETMRLDKECRGFILFLEQINVLDMETREMVIDRVMELDIQDFLLDDLKWVVLMVLFNVPGHESAYTQMEELVFDEPEGPLH